jgi:hypothetical protein
MAKRQTDTFKWDDPWFASLSHQSKLLWLYLLDQLDHAGIWEPNLRKLNFDLDIKITESEILEIFSDRIQSIGKYWYVPKFILFQYGPKFVEFLQNPDANNSKESKVFRSIFNRLILLGTLKIEKGLIVKIKPFDTLY